MWAQERHAMLDVVVRLIARCLDKGTHRPDLGLGQEVRKNPATLVSSAKKSQVPRNFLTLWLKLVGRVATTCTP